MSLIEIGAEQVLENSMNWINMNWIKKSVPFLVIVAICIGVLELGSYLIWKNILAVRASNGVFMVNRILDEPGLLGMQGIVSHPYSLYWNNPQFTDGYGRQYDDMGYRNTTYQPKENEIRILVLGGSTTNSYPYTKDRDKIWTNLLEKSLAKDLGRPVHIFNAGLPYGTSAELMVHYLLNGKHLKPHLVIFHEGGNDVAPLLFPGYKTDYSHFRKSNNALPRPLERRLLKISNTARVIYAIWLRNQGVYQAQPTGFELLNRTDATQRAKDNMSPAFESNVSVITHEAVTDGSKVLLVGFLQARRSNLSKNRSDISGLEDAFIIGVEKHDNIMQSIAQKHRQSFLKLDQAKFADEWFLDNCHLNELGEAEKARQIHFSVINVLKQR